MNAPLTMRGLECQSAIDYFLDILERAGCGDGSRNRAQLAKGSFFAIVPHDASPEQVMRFGAGGLLQGESEANCAVVRKTPDTIPTITALVAEQAHGLADPVLWLHEPLLREDEIAAPRLIPRRVGNALFLLAEGDNARRPDRIAESLEYALLSWHFLAFVADGVHCADNVFRLLERANMIVAGAYDGESALLWYRA